MVLAPDHGSSESLAAVAARAHGGDHFPAREESLALDARPVGHSSGARGFHEAAEALDESRAERVLVQVAELGLWPLSRQGADELERVRRTEA